MRLFPGLRNDGRGSNPFSPRRGRRPGSRDRRATPGLERLEGRTVLSPIGLTVSSLADSGPGTLRAAILSADAGSHSDKFTIGFSVAGTIDLQTPLPDLNNTIAVQGPGASSLTVERASGVTFTSAILTVDPGRTASLSGLTIANGDDGGIANHGGTLTVSGCTISGNSGIRINLDTYGGGIYNLNDFGTATLTVIGSTISGNTATFGGGIVSGGPLTVTGCTISDNSAFDGGGILTFNGTVSGSTLSGNSATGGGGGGIDNEGTLAVTGGTVSGNTALDGGGIDNDGTLTVAGTSLSGNSVHGTAAKDGAGPFAGLGGAIFNGGFLTVGRCTFTGNSASDLILPTGSVLAGEGGGIFNGDFATATVRDTLLADNSAADGGGIDNVTRGTLNVRGCTFSGNSADDSGGGVYNAGAATFQECTLTGNSAGSDGGGLFNAATGTLTIDDSVVRHNVAQSGADLYNLGSATLHDSTVDQVGP